MRQKSAVGAAGADVANPVYPPDTPEEKFRVEVDEESPVGVLEPLVDTDDGVSDSGAGKEADNEVEEVNPFGGALAMAISGFESESFIFPRLS